MPPANGRATSQRAGSSHTFVLENAQVTGCSLDCPLSTSHHKLLAYSDSTAYESDMFTTGSRTRPQPPISAPSTGYFPQEHDPLKGFAHNATSPVHTPRIQPPRRPRCTPSEEDRQGQEHLLMGPASCLGTIKPGCAHTLV
ncbi:uncharacterized protein SETTUDRAFT_18561 [Exserohilum turcica Et28A]|uniref:Uncharacterized protein n=1 Tax=Exserohilum turcicum (strain 28A) TaxID=671987 RepID=R0KGB4_EXST2|nr:uncharacterized protein SETTUDRAFT_18561 [Exserohilum turcica Et28A]EOA91898.1 hypothetical protein SETTUDRAFT_18561 [Exserohilum turcica Et28A]